MPIALSHSRLSDFNQCPYKFKSKYIDKTWPDESDKQCFVKGNRIHKACEQLMLAARAGKELTHPDLSLKAVRAAVPLIQAISSSYKTVHAELQAAINENFKAVSWFDKSTMYRAIYDVLAINDDKALAVDWKSGKFSPYSGYGGQLHLASTVIMSMYPEVQEVRCIYAFLEHEKKDEQVIKRSELAQLQGYFMDEYEKVNRETEWAPKVNAFCHWCMVDKCKYKTPND